MANVERIHFCHYYLSFGYFKKSKIVTQYTYLYTSLSKVNFHCQVFSCEHIWIVGLSKCCFQFFQLLQCKCGTISTLLTSYKCFIMDGRMIWIAGICNRIKLQKANFIILIESIRILHIKRKAKHFNIQLIQTQTNRSNGSSYKIYEFISFQFRHTMDAIQERA